MSKVIVTEYIEQSKTAQEFNLGSISDKDHGFPGGDSPLIITFDEHMFEDEDEDEESCSEPEVLILPLDDVGDKGSLDDMIEFIEGESGEKNKESDETFDMSGSFGLPGTESDETIDSPSSFRLPGATDYVDDNKDSEVKEEVADKVTDWINDRDPSHFMEYIKTAYPDGIPAHDGSSTLGCERAILFLTHRNKEISEALRSDKNDALDLPTLEGIRVNMIRDMVTLKEHIKKLNKRHKKGGTGSVSIKKEAGTAQIQLIMTPWERAITGMIINSVVSAGKPFEDVYEFLKKKYKFTDREELAILQILMDMGQPIFKDRGSIGESDNDGDGEGVDFMKNYFA